MQIFVTSSCPRESAERLWRSPNRARKMITETQQILACCQEKFYGQVTIKKANGDFFKVPLSRKNHPVVKWACKDLDHMRWVLGHLCCLKAEYEGDKFLNVEDNILVLCDQLVTVFSDFSLLTFLNFAKNDAKGLDFTNEPDVFLAYDKFLKAQGA